MFILFIDDEYLYIVFLPIIYVCKDLFVNFVLQYW